MNTCLLALIDLSAPEVENTASSNSYVAKINRTSILRALLGKGESGASFGTSKLMASIDPPFPSLLPL